MNHTDAHQHRSPETPRTTSSRVILQTELPTDRPPEVIRIQRLTGADEVEFWSVSASERHWSMVHDTYATCLVLGGSGKSLARWRSRGATRDATGGCIQLMEPGEAHRTVEVSAPTSFFVVFWHPRLLQRAARELGIAGHLHWRSAQLQAGAVTASFELLARRVNRSQDRLCIEECVAETLRDVVIGAAEGTPARSSPGGAHRGVRRVVELLQDSFREPLTLDDLAREARLSKFHLVRCFRRATGFAPHQFLKLLRVREARRLLARGATVSESAERSGFADGPHLNRVFREAFGCSPGAFRRA